MSGPGIATAAVRVAVRRSVADLAPDAPVAAAVSGGADSLALAAALAFERPGSHALVVDHGLQDGSAEVAATAAGQCRELGLVADVLTVTAGAPHGGPRDGGGSGHGGPEGRARGLRYAALQAASTRIGSPDEPAVVLLGHTLDDQAETVLLGLARGSGARSLSGMPAERGRFRRPLLGLTRETTCQAVLEAGLQPWEDPHNDDPSYSRVRVRATLLPALEAGLGPGVAAALARSAGLLREDADALDALAADALEALAPDPLDPLDVSALAALLPAVRSRVLRTWTVRRGGRAVTAAHVDGLRALVEDWHGQGPVHLPGGARVRREHGRLAFDP